MIRTIVTEGGAGERGYEQGRLLREEIAGLYARWLACGARQRQPLGERDLLSFACAHVPAARSCAARAVQEIDGLAQGADVSFEQIFLLNCWDELCSLLAVRDASAAAGGCTSFGVAPAGDQAVVIGQNQDAWGWWRPVVVVESRPAADDDPAAVYVGHPGVLTTLGVNEHGVGVVANSLVPRDRRVGVPFSLLLREVLAQRTLGEAIGAVLRAPRATGANFVIAGPDGVVDIEATGQDADVHYVAIRMAHSNHYLCDRLAPLDLGAAMLPDTFLREGRLRLLLGDPDPVTPQRAVALLSDHLGAPTAICRHPAQTPDEIETLGAAVILPGERAIYLTDGPPCSSQVERHPVPAAACSQRPPP